MKNKEKAIIQIMSRFGAPQIQSQIATEQIKIAISIAKEEFKSITSLLPEKKYKKRFKNFWIKRYALAICKEILGRMREHIDHMTIAGEKYVLKADSLLSESAIEKQNLISMIY